MILKDYNETQMTTNIQLFSQLTGNTLVFLTANIGVRDFLVVTRIYSLHLQGY